MEESISLLSQIKETFACKETDIRTYSPITLAFLGDCIYDLVIRTVLVERCNRDANSLHKIKSAVVKADAQAEMIEALLPELKEEEAGVYRRGRNAKTSHTAKNASVVAYRKATGFEALMGYLYLTEQTDRLLFLVKKGLTLIGKEI